ncbi:glycosyl hydrolase family 18 protein [Tenacibaculum sp. nBUS_03]|uniref:glycosyl hydrolase family 18 protein n=1 Tax=Tenacibaculum sp. nBUS_03 TaxID=3395320 RepID=UPI003EBF4C71
MKKIVILFYFLFLSILVNAQYQFPDCSPAWDASNAPYRQGDKVSHNGLNYTAKWYTNAAPGDSSWQNEGACGDGGLGPDYAGKQRIIGYLPTWIPDYDITNNFNPEVVTNINVSFLMFKRNNNDYNSNDFGSIAFDDFQLHKVDSVLTDCKVLEKSKAKNVKVSVALGGATDFAFLWLMTKYHNNDQKLEEIADLLVNYVNERQLDGIDLDLECWWADPSIAGTSDQGGRVRGSKWGDQDQGPHPAAIGMTNLSRKLRQKMPNKLITAAVFGTSWYGNNYDADVAEYLDWIGLMTYDFTGSWDDSPIGPHSSLYKVPLNTYTGQSADNPIYSAQDALEYWLGIAPATWNHDGGFGIKKAKLVIGVPMYGYDFSEGKPNGGNGAKFVPYRNIIEEAPNAATSYDAKDPNGLGGHVTLNGTNIYFDTPKQAGEKIKYTKDYGHQGVIIWELTQDVDYNSSSSILRAINEAAGNSDPINSAPKVTWVAPTSGEVIEQETLSEITLTATATDSDGSVTSFRFVYMGEEISATKSGAEYSANFTPSAFGEVEVSAVAVDNENATSTSVLSFTVKRKSNDPDPNTPPVIASVKPANGSEIEKASLSSITLKATVTDDKSVETVQFYVDNMLVTPVTQGINDTYEAVWTPGNFGSFTLKVVATDGDGGTTTSTSTFSVKEEAAGNICDNITPWEVRVYAVAGSEVKYNGAIYKNKWYASRSERPGSSDVWDYVQSCTGGDVTYCGSKEWMPSKVYNTGDKVYYNESIFRARWWTRSNTPESSNVWEFISACTESRANNAMHNLAYPTLVKDEITISMEMKRKSNVTIELYNLSGQLIRVFVKENNFKGVKALQSDVSDLERGIYIYKIKVNGQAVTKKLILTK